MGEIFKYGRIWGTNESTLSKTAGAGPYGSTYILALHGEHAVKVLYDNFSHSKDGEIPHENFTLDIIDTNTQAYPDWLIHYYPLTSVITPLGSALRDVYPDNTPLGYSWNEWRFICKWNWLQDTDTTSRSMEITFTENETGESVTHTLTQPGAAAANKTPINLQPGYPPATKPLVTASVGKINVRFDKDDTFVGFGYPGDPTNGYGERPGKWYSNLSASAFYTDGNRYDPVWDVKIIDQETGLPATWVTFRETKNIKLATRTRMKIDFILDFEENTTGRIRYFEVTITELRHNESITITSNQPQR